ncbi:hypothetical protein N7G274_009924 [Stereocaulon virgatum]|uniref:SAP domain-containing protein n=1 Tax=Stereocaulon virgatum TaxID=373712 RepID=A0ABR3ZV05_9LECA
MSTDYKSKKVADLTELLRARSLPHSGKKDELIQRLEKHDAEQAAAKPPPTTTTTTAAADGAEDEIDWEDDADATDNPAAAAAMAAGGLVQPRNPTSVPNQIVDIDPSKTSDLTVNPPAQAVTTTSTRTADTTTTTTTTTTSQTKEPEKDHPPKPDYTTGLASTTLDTELEKRKKRAARFGIQETDTDALKALERAKKFGTGDAGDKAAVRGLDEALPERSRKRGRGGDESGGGRQGGEKRSRNREKGGTLVGGEGGRGGGEGGRGGGGGGKGERGYSEADRAKAEERKRRFG